LDTGEEYFTDAVEEAKKIEKKALKYKAYDGAVNVRHDIDLYPSDYVDVDYRDLINVYDRAQKIKKASKMKIYTAPGMPSKEVKAPPPEKKAMSETEAKKISEVESRLKNITSEALKKAEEIAASGKAEEEAPPETKPEPVAHPEIEFERGFEKEEVPAKKKEPEELEIELEKPPEPEKPEEKEIKIEKPAPPPPEPVELEKEEPSLVEKIEEPQAPKKIKEPEEEKPVAEEAEVILPKMLESPDEAAEKKFRQIEEEVKSTMGRKVDEKEIKKKMLELTKQLFKEKSMDRREEIKHEIAALKNMLSAKKAPAARKAGAKTKRGRKKAPKEEAAKLQVFQTLISTQESEIAQTKDEITSSFRHKIDGLKTKFYDDLSVAETPDEKKKLYDRLVFELTKLNEQLPGTVGKFKEYNTKKHLAELRRMKESLGPKDKDARVQVDERIKNVETKYAEMFGVLHDLLSKRIEGVMRTASKDVFEKKPEEERTVVEKEEAKVDEVISEISNLDPGTLLYYLHSKEPEYYKMYERKRVSKAEALSRARVLMAKEKGLTDDLIGKYFGTVEG